MLEQLIAGLRDKGFEVRPMYIQANSDGFSARQFIPVNGVNMPIEVAQDLNRGLVMLDEIAANVHRFSN